MAVSSSIDFSMTAVELITEARALIGIGADEEPLQAYELQRGLRTLTMMLKSWQTEGVMIWTYSEGTLTLVESDADYLFGAGGTVTTLPFEIVNCRIVRSSVETPMTRMSRQDYYDLPNKTVEGFPTQFYYDRQRASGTLYVWPAPDSSAGTLKFTTRRGIMDVDLGTEHLDLPQEWYETVLYNLGKRLMPFYPSASQTPTAAMVITEAQRLYDIAKGWDVGEGAGSLTILPYHE